jgi:hypothetical protein
MVTAGLSAIVVLDARDPDGPEPSVEILSDPGAVVTSQTGLSLSVLAPDAGTFTVTYRVSDGEALSRVATLTIQAAPAVTVPPSG